MQRIAVVGTIVALSCVLLALWLPVDMGALPKPAPPKATLQAPTTSITVKCERHDMDADGQGDLMAYKRLESNTIAWVCTPNGWVQAVERYDLWSDPWPLMQRDVPRDPPRDPPFLAPR